MDERGNVVCVQTRFEGAKEAAYLATQDADPLVSQFSPTYGMVLNLLQRLTLKQVESLLQRSFAQYLANQRLLPEQQAIAQLTQQITRIDVQIASIPREYLTQYEKLKARLKEQRRIVKYLEKQAQRDRAPALASALTEIEPGQLLYLKGKYVTVSSPIPTIFIDSTASSGQSAIYICLGADNRWYIATQSDIKAIGDAIVSKEQLALLEPPPDLELKPGKRRKGNQQSTEIAKTLQTAPEPEIEPPEVIAEREKIENIQQQMSQHPLHNWGKPTELLKTYHRRQQLQDELQQRQANTRQHQSQHWREFLNICEVLKAFGALYDYHPTTLGQTAAAIRGDNELWLGLALTSGHLDHLPPSQLAAASCALVTETPRPDSESSFPPPQPVMEALGKLRNLRRQLFQVQRQYQVALPLWLETDLIGLVEQWVEGMEWQDLCEATTLDEGDLVRILRRTRDFLSQMPYVPHVAESLRDNARNAVEAMERFPVQEFED